MRIIREGKNFSNERQFYCSRCGCIFIANEAEYDLTPQMTGEYDYTITCPNCGFYCSNSTEVKEETANRYE